MSENTKALKAALAPNQTSISRSLRHIQSTKRTPTPSNALYLSTSTKPLHHSLLTLLKHLRQNITSLSLAFSGKTITIDAAIVQLGKVSGDYDRIGACVVGAPGEGCLMQEWRAGVEDIGEKVLRLIEIFTEDVNNPPSTPTPFTSTSPPPAKPYLIQTSSLWSSIDSLSQTSSSTEQEAIIRLWKRDREMMDDAVEEFKELGVEEDEGVDVDDEGENDGGGVDEEGGEWAELERELNGSTERMTAEERARIKSLDTIIRLTLTLHSHYLKTLLSPKPPKTPSLNRFLSFPSHLTSSSSLAASLDTLVSNLYAPQDEREVRKSVQGVVGSGRGMCEMSLEAANMTEGKEGKEKAVDGADEVDAAVEALEKVKLDDAEAMAVAKEKKWLEFWLGQMDKAVAARAT